MPNTELVQASICILYSLPGNNKETAKEIQGQIDAFMPRPALPL